MSVVFPPDPEPASPPGTDWAFWIFGPLATVLSTCALVSLIAGGFSLSLKPWLASALAAYHGLAHGPLHAAIDTVGAVLPSLANPPVWANDFAALFLAAALCLASFFADDLRRNYGNVLGLLLAAALVPLLAVLSPFAVFLTITRLELYFDLPIRVLLFSLWSPIPVTTAILIANAYA